MEPKEFAFITLEEELLGCTLNSGLLGRIRCRGLLQSHVLALRDFAIDQRGTVDDRPYGGGDGMILRPEPLAQAVRSLPERQTPWRVVLTSARGTFFRDEDARRLADCDQPIAFVCGRFGGVDQRFVERYVDEEFCVGAFVVSGGEWPALMMADAIARHWPDSLGHSTSALQDSFSPAFSGKREHPSYTRPQTFEGLDVPEELLSGDHDRIECYRARLRDACENL